MRSVDACGYNILAWASREWNVCIGMALFMWVFRIIVCPSIGIELVRIGPVVRVAMNDVRHDIDFGL
jgi:hypothetical protein